MDAVESDEKILQRKLSSGFFTRFDAKVIEGTKKKNVSCMLSPRVSHQWLFLLIVHSA